MTTAAAVFACTVALAFLQGFGMPAFAGIVAADAFDATLPFLGILVVARFAARRRPDSLDSIERVHAIVQGALVATGFGWWWLEPHATLTTITGSSLAATLQFALCGGLYGAAAAALAARTSSPVVVREVALASLVVFFTIGGFAYRCFDHVESGTRATTALAILAAVVAVAAAAIALLRGRERLASGIPALTPALAALALAFASTQPGPAMLSDRDSVLLIVVDTLRADIADGSFDGRTGTMPGLERIAKDGIRFTQAISPAPWTLPATVSLLSGWNPHRHGYGRSASSWEVSRGDPKAFHLQPSLRDAGYLTSAFVHNPWLRPWYGFDGFYTLRPYHGRALDGVALALDWMRAHAAAPWVTFLHLMDPHWPYDAPPEPGVKPADCPRCDSLLEVQYRGADEAMRKELRRRYADEVRYTDEMLGRLYDELVASGALSRTWIVITSDHGEEFWEHGGFLHGHALNDELLRVPLVIVPPRAVATTTDDEAAKPVGDPAAPDRWKRGVRVDAQVRLEDVAATVLDIAGLDVAAAKDGASLLPMMEAGGAAGEAPRTAVAGYVKSPVDLRYAVRRPPWKAVLTPGVPGWSSLYDLSRDPAETRSVLFDSSSPPLRRLAVGAAFRDLAAEPARLGLEVERKPLAASSAEPDADTERNLRALGYVD